MPPAELPQPSPAEVGATEGQKFSDDLPAGGVATKTENPFSGLRDEVKLGVSTVVEVQPVARIEDRSIPGIKDLFRDGSPLGDLTATKEAIHQESERTRKFREQVNSIISPRSKIDGTIEDRPVSEKTSALKELYGQMRTEQLSVQETAAFINLLRSFGDHESVVKIFEESQNPTVTSSEILQEFYAVALNKTGRFSETITFCSQLIEKGVKNGEVYSAMGKAYRELSKQSATEGRQEKSRDYLTQSYESYLQGYLTDFEFYPGINAVYNLQFLGRNAEAEKLAQMVYASSEVAGGLQSRDYWCLTTMLELACITKKPASEINMVLGQVIKFARSKDEIEGSTLPMIRRLREQRATSQEQTEDLDRVVGVLERKAHQLTTGGAESVQPLNGDAQVPEEQLLRFFYNYLGQAEGPVSHFIGGNIEWKGQLHAEVINRSDIKKAKVLLAQLGLDGIVDLKVFNQVVDSLIRRQFGTLALEDLHSPEHQVYDRTVKGLLDFTEGKSTGGHTNIMVDLEAGLGDCRHHAYSKQLLFDAWKRNNIDSELNKAYVALTQNNDEAEFNRILTGTIPELQKNQMYVYDMSVQAPIQTEGMYIPVERNGMWVANPANEVQPIEEHTANVLVIHDPQKGYLITFADGFYQEKHYRWGYHQQSEDASVPLSFLVENGYLPAGKIQVVNPQTGELTSVDVQAFPAPYAGARQRQVYDNFGGTLMRGIPVESTPQTLVRNLGLTGEPPAWNIRKLKQQVQSF